MPDEAVQWVRRMLTYTVAGGKMNRGLSLMAVQTTLAQSAGRSLSDKVNISFIFATIQFKPSFSNRNVVSLLLWVGVLNSSKHFS